VSICVEAVNQLQAFKVVLHLWEHCCDTSKCCIYMEPAQPSSVLSLPANAPSAPASPSCTIERCRHKAFSHGHGRLSFMFNPSRI